MVIPCLCCCATVRTCTGGGRYSGSTVLSSPVPSTAAEPSNRLQHSNTEFQRFPQRTLSPISLIMSINIRKRVGSVENLPERSTSLPGASSQCGTLHFNCGTALGFAIFYHISCFSKKTIRCPCNTLPERNVLHKKSMLDDIPDIFVKLYIAGCRKINDKRFPRPVTLLPE